MELRAAKVGAWRFRRRVGSAIAFASAALASQSAVSAQTASSASAAQSLFDDAKAAVKKGDLASACPKFAESHRLDPAGGTILHAADCHQSAGKLATALTEYEEALSYALRDRRSDREKIARANIAALGPRVGKLAIDVDIETAQVEGVAIALDGVRIAAAAWTTALSVDKGRHVLVASAPRRETMSVEVQTADAITTRARIPALIVTPEPQKPTLVAPIVTPEPARAAPEPHHGGGFQRTAGFALLGIGIVGAGVGLGFGVAAMSKGDQSGRCTLGPNGDGCPRGAVDDQDAARRSGTIATIGVTAGLIAGAAGAVLLLTAPRRSPLGSARLGLWPTAAGASITLGGTL